LVFNAASVFGAPIRFPDASSEVTARTEVVRPVVPIARGIVDLNDVRSRRSVVPRARLLEVRDLLEEVIESREPVEQRADEPIMRRYPRQVYHDFYEKRAPEPAPVPAPVVEETTVVRRYPRRALYDLHEKREPATTVKETTMVITKLTTHDTPADAAAFASVVAAGGPQASASSSASTSATTIINVSQTSTIAAAGSDATPTGTSTSSAASSSITATSTASDASPSASSAAGEPTPTSSGSASPSSTASATSTSDGTKPTDAPVDPATVDPATPATPPAAGGENKTDPPTDGGDKKDDKKDEPPATPAADGADKPQGFTTPTRRELIPPVANTIARRQLGVSGAAMASAVRRGLPLSIH